MVRRFCRHWRRRLPLGPAAIAAATVFAMPAEAQTEAQMRDRLCRDYPREVATAAGTRVDCVSASFAIEIDWTEKWAEAIGQALHYAAETGLHPAIILICHQSEASCLGHRLRLESTLAHWRLPMFIWLCDRWTKQLRQCSIRKFS